ncbi:MAG: class I SAM-dependent methyltransferase [Anaerolineae bacterium]
MQNTAVEVDFILDELADTCLPGLSSARFLDVGCGTGRHALALAQRGYSVVGLDLSESMVRQGFSAARERDLGVDFVVGDARELPFRGGFDVALILCEGGFSLVESDEMDRAILQGVARALRQGGRLMMTAPHAAYVIAHAREADGFDVVTCREAFEIGSTDRDGRTRALQGT